MTLGAARAASCWSMARRERADRFSSPPSSDRYPRGPWSAIATGSRPPVRSARSSRLPPSSGSRRRCRRRTCSTRSRDRWGEEPSILVIEDAHSADDATSDFPISVGRRIVEAGTLLIVSHRDDEIGPDHPLRILLGELTRFSSTRRIAVPRLSSRGVAELVDGTGLDPEEAHRLTGGNPFFLTEMVAAGSTEPQTVHDAVLARAARLPPASRLALDVASQLDGRGRGGCDEGTRSRLARSGMRASRSSAAIRSSPRRCRCSRSPPGSP